MDTAVVTKAEGFLSLASMRLLVPPLHILSASMWQILQQRDVMSFWKVSEFVSFVMEAVPELLLFKHWTQLTLGLRARFILELYRRGQDQKLILSHLEKMKPQHSTLDQELSDEEKAGDDFAKMIHALLKDSQERHLFFQEVWSEEYGPQFDCDLHMLFWEFLCRLNQLLPVPALEQTVMWLGESCILEDFLQCLSELTHMKNLLYHHKQVGHLEQHVPPSNMGDHILTSLMAASQKKLPKAEAKFNLKTGSDPLSASNEDLQPISFVENAAMEIFTVTGCAEIELTSSTTDIQVLVIDNSAPNDPNGEETMIALPEDVEDVKENGAMEETSGLAILKDESQEAASSDIEVVFIDGVPSINTVGEEISITQDENITKNMEEREANNASAFLDNNSRVVNHKRTSGPHDCPDCDKKFKFASCLVAHRVVHTGERPHKCSECGQCFSFRQSLERHRLIHKTGKSFACPICHECFPSSAARNEHKQIHTKKEGYNCQLCGERFTHELDLSQHMKTHSDINSNEEIVEINGSKQKVGLTQENAEEKASETVEEQSVKTDVELKMSDNQVIDAQLMSKVITLVQVRMSRRKRSVTKKMRLLQKQMEKLKEAKAKTKATNPVQPMDSTDHSYGTTMTSSKTVHKGVVKEGGPFSCPLCDFCHSEENHIQQHMNDYHPNRAKKPKTLEATEKVNERCKTDFKCLICGELLKSLKDLKDHTTSSHMRNGVYFCSRCDKNYTWKGAFIRHVKMYCSDKGTNGFACPHCELVFDCASKLFSHAQTHQEEKVHVCICGKSFAYKGALNAHRRTHQKERPHVCHQCGKGFHFKGGLRVHMKIHSQEMPFICSYCGKGFKREPNMKKHERCHTREHVFKCSQCDKSFVYKATLTRHELTHTGERPYLCSDCGKGFFSHAELLKHERFHTGHKPFECPYCGKRFTQSCYLTVHLRYHTGAKPYSCSQCEKSFLSANRLKRHMRTHTGEKPYVCGECGKGFRQSYHLKLHQRTHVIELTYK